MPLFLRIKTEKEKDKTSKENFLDHKVQPNAAKETDARPYETDLSNPLRYPMGRHTTSSTRPQETKKCAPTMPVSMVCAYPSATLRGTPVSPKTAGGAGAM